MNGVLNTGSLTLQLSHVSRESSKPPVECVGSRQYNFFINLVECVDFSDLARQMCVDDECNLEKTSLLIAHVQDIQ